MQRDSFKGTAVGIPCGVLDDDDVVMIASVMNRNSEDDSEDDAEDHDDGRGDDGDPDPLPCRQRPASPWPARISKSEVSQCFGFSNS